MSESLEEMASRQRAGSPLKSVLTLLVMAAVLGAVIGGLTLLSRWINGPPAGAYSEIVVEFYTDGSQACKGQEKVINELDAEYEGSIRFVTVDVLANPKAVPESYEKVPCIRIVKIWYDADGEQISYSSNGMGKTPKRSLVPLIEQIAESNQKWWPDTPINRNRKAPAP